MSQEVTPKLLRLYRTKEGRLPFIEWLRGLRDERARQKIQVRLDRLSLGNLGNVRAVGEGIHELKIDFGPGFRVYFGVAESSVVLLLIGGDKSSQNEDIKKAKRYWKEFKSESAYED
jgi:putative addiction module killer protein